MSCRIVVLISGNGSNLQAIIDACRAGQIDGQIVSVISNVPQAYGLQRAQQVGIASQIIDHRDFSNRHDFDRALQAAIESSQPDLVVLAGFMRILGNELVQANLGRMINIHPSLLPKYPGLNTHARAIAAGDREHGATVHFVTPELDGGPAIAQSRCPVLPGDSPESLAERVHGLEHRLFPRVIAWYADQRLRLVDNKTELDGTVLTCAKEL